MCLKDVKKTLSRPHKGFNLLKKTRKTKGKKDLIKIKITKRKLNFFKIMLLNPDGMFESNVHI